MISDAKNWKVNTRETKVIADERGFLGELNLSEIPFPAKRIYWIHAFEEETRGRHAHISLRQFLIVLSGKFSITLDDGISSHQVELKVGDNLILEAGVWREFRALDGDAILLVIASQEYDDLDYIRDYDLFIKSKHAVL